MASNNPSVFLLMINGQIEGGNVSIKNPSKTR